MNPFNPLSIVQSTFESADVQHELKELVEIIRAYDIYDMTSYWLSESREIIERMDLMYSIYHFSLLDCNETEQEIIIHTARELKATLVSLGI